MNTPPIPPSSPEIAQVRKYVLETEIPTDSAAFGFSPTARIWTPVRDLLMKIIRRMAARIAP